MYMFNSVLCHAGGESNEGTEPTGNYGKCTTDYITSRLASVPLALATQCSSPLRNSVVPQNDFTTPRQTDDHCITSCQKSKRF